MLSEAPRAQRGASRKGDFFYIVPLAPAYPPERDGALAGQMNEILPQVSDLKIKVQN